MSVKRYFAASARDCLRKVKEDLGPDAIVVSNKSLRGGIEITAMSAASLDEISSQAVTAEYAGEEKVLAAGGSRHAIGYSALSNDDYTVNLSTQARQFGKRTAPAAPARGPIISPWQPPRYEPETGRITPALSPVNNADARPAAKPALAESVSNRASSLSGVDDLTREMQDIRSLLEQQLAGFAWGELSRTSPMRARLMTELLEMGFSGVLARRMTQEMKAETTFEEGRNHVAAILDRRLRLFDADSDLIHRGGVYALVGPTGVGKTTTTAKLAARCVLHYGADRVALVTTDGYRIAAHEQLRIYGRILGVPVYPVGTSDELRQTLALLKDKHMVLIDTVGMSQRDRLVVEQGAMLASNATVKRLLLLNATSRGDTLDDVIRAYGGEDISSCIVSKTDETTSLAPAVDAAVRHGLTIAYLANGQRVPEDLHLPNRKYLLHRVFKQVQGNMAHRLRPEEVGMALAGNSALQDMAGTHID